MTAYDNTWRSFQYYCRFRKGGTTFAFTTKLRHDELCKTNLPPRMGGKGLRELVMGLSSSATFICLMRKILCLTGYLLSSRFPSFCFQNKIVCVICMILLLVHSITGCLQSSIFPSVIILSKLYFSLCGLGTRSFFS